MSMKDLSDKRTTDGLQLKLAEKNVIKLKKKQRKRMKLVETIPLRKNINAFDVNKLFYASADDGVIYIRSRKTGKTFSAIQPDGFITNLRFFW